MIQVQLRPEVEAWLADEAQARGIQVEEYASAVIERAAPIKPGSPFRSPEEIRAWVDSLAQFSDAIPPMPGEVFSREWIYQDHD
jgi:hypothetical protein